MHYILEKGEWSRTSHIVHGGILGLILISTLSVRCIDMRVTSYIVSC